MIPIPYSYLAPDSYVETNVRGTLNLCQAARAAGVTRFVHTSTSEVYGTAQYVPIDEEHPLTPQSPYSATKIGADAIALSFFYAFALAGRRRQTVQHLWSAAVGARRHSRRSSRSSPSATREVRLGDLTTTRDFTFVEDTCRGLLADRVHARAAPGEVFNIGSNREISIGDSADHDRAASWASSARRSTDAERLRPAASEVQRLRCDGTKLERATGFHPSVSLQRRARANRRRGSGTRRTSRATKADLYNV